MTTTIRWLGLVAVVWLAACSEQPQTAGARKVDEKPWQGTTGPFAAAGWKTGDRASWEEEIRQRSQAQNEYLRTPAKP